MDGIIDSIDTNFSKLQEIQKDSLACCSHWVTELDMTEQLNNNNQKEKLENNPIYN